MYDAVKLPMCDLKYQQQLIHRGWRASGLISNRLSLYLSVTSQIWVFAIEHNCCGLGELVTGERLVPWEYRE